jgi:hypothetical protein
LSFKLEQTDLEDARYPWRMRYCALQNVTLNLPRIAYQCDGDDTKLFTKISEVFHKAVQAHLEKKAFLERLLSLGETGPLALLTMKKDGMPYLRMHRVTNLIGMVGLNEMVQIHRGEQLHDSDAALKFGLKVIAYMKLAVKNEAGLGEEVKRCLDERVDGIVSDITPFAFEVAKKAGLVQVAEQLPETLESDVVKWIGSAGGIFQKRTSARHKIKGRACLQALFHLYPRRELPMSAPTREHCPGCLPATGDPGPNRIAFLAG